MGKLESQLNKLSCASSENQVRPNAQLNMHKEITHTQPIKCEFWTCDYEASSSTVLKRHITMKHKIDESFVYPSSLRRTSVWNVDICLLSITISPCTSTRNTSMGFHVTTATSIFLATTSCFRSTSSSAPHPATGTLGARAKSWMTTLINIHLIYGYYLKPKISS